MVFFLFIFIFFYSTAIRWRFGAAGSLLLFGGDSIKKPASPIRFRFAARSLTIRQIPVGLWAEARAIIKLIPEYNRILRSHADTHDNWSHAEQDTVKKIIRLSREFLTALKSHLV